jgi:hypothetical protein
MGVIGVRCVWLRGVEVAGAVGCAVKCVINESFNL